ncbi:MAG: 1,4-dihydroxy-6-naphthoate synthase [Desulfobulbus sp.]|nr:1,4-dihydroxy-6-naphthoate synthase [Desulfobulbus sp.]
MSDISALSLGFSPCPNDTYIFNALVHGQVQPQIARLQSPILEDVETLNDWAMQGRLDVSKLSFHALGHVLDQYTLLPSGAALGRGCGPLLITGSGANGKPLSQWKIAIPGRLTTAALLLRLYHPACEQLVVMRFDQIMDAILQGSVDGGVIIHESRFTYQTLGLRCVQDLGEWWESTTGLPLPLGCIVARRSLAEAVRTDLSKAITASIHWADSHPHACLPYIREHSQELEIDVVNSHIGLYVNPYSKDIGEEGLQAVRELLHRGAEIGLFPRSAHLL